MKNLFRNALMGTLAMVTAFALAQTPQPTVQNVVQLSASGAVQTPQDWLTISLNTTQESADATTVQNLLKAALEPALAEARKHAAAGQMEVRTGSFSLYPRSGKDGRISTWQGRAELILEGRDFAKISAIASKLQTLTVAQASFSLSRERRAQVESEAQAIAIDQFKKRAADIARGFGFDHYSLREISVGSNDFSPGPRPRMMAMEARAPASESPIPVEAGLGTVTVTISGSVQLR